MSLIPRFTFKIRIQDFLAAYQADEKRTYLCDFTEYYLIPGRNLFWRIWVAIRKSMRPGCRHGLGFKNVWLGKFGGEGYLMEGWVANHPDFVQVNSWKRLRINTNSYDERTYRILCLRRAAELHPDWVLEFKI